MKITQRLNSIAVRGYRSIKDMHLELRPLNVLIGANGAGKSTARRLRQRQVSGTDRKSMSRCARTGDPSASHSQTTSTSQPRSRSAVIFR